MSDAEILAFPGSQGGQDNVPIWVQRLRVEVAAAKKAGRSQAAIAKAAGISDSTLSSVLLNQKDTTVDNFLRICQALNQDPGYILGGPDMTPRGAEAAKLLVQLPSEEDQRDALHALELYVRGLRQP